MSAQTYAAKQSAIALLLLVHLLLLGPSMRADIGDPDALQPPPLPVPITVEVGRGGTVQIPLRAQTRSTTAIRFLLRSAPSHGRIGELRMTSPQSGSVTYAHDGSDATEDRFNYAAQSQESGVSAAVAVTILIREASPVLSAPGEIDFGQVAAGSRAIRPFTIRNSGGGVLTGSLETEAPWELLDGAEYSLKAGAQRTFHLQFDPSEIRGYLGVLKLSGNQPREVRLVGSCFAPFDVTPRKIEADGPTDSTQQIQISNRSPKAIDLQVEAAEALGLPAKLRLEATSHKLLPIYPPKNTEGFEGRIIVRLGDLSVEIPVSFPPEGPRIIVTPAAGLDFESVRITESANRKVVLRNTGGQPARIALSTEAPFLMQDSEHSFDLGVGESHEAVIAFRPDHEGAVSGTLKLRVDETEQVLGLRGSGLSRMAPVPSPRPSASPVAAPVKTPASLMQWQAQPVKQLRLVDHGKTWFEVEWDIPSTPVAAYRFEGRKLSLTPERTLRTEWLEVPGTTPVQIGRVMRARATELRPGGVYTVQVVCVSAEGQSSVASLAFQATTKPSFRFALHPAHILIAIFVLFAAIFAKQKWQANRKQE